MWDVRSSSPPTTIKLISTFSHFFANLFAKACVCICGRDVWYLVCVNAQEKKELRKTNPVQTVFQCFASTSTVCMQMKSVNVQNCCKKGAHWKSASERTAFNALFSLMGPLSPSLAAHMQYNKRRKKVVVCRAEQKYGRSLHMHFHCVHAFQWAHFKRFFFPIRFSKVSLITLWNYFGNR